VARLPQLEPEKQFPQCGKTGKQRIAVIHR
jgi:hypothetical protein